MASKAHNVVGIVTTLAATALARKLVDATWKLGAGKEPPSDPTDPETRVAEAVLFAVLSGAAVGVAKMLAGRRMAASARRQVGTGREAKRAGAKALSV